MLRWSNSSKLSRPDGGVPLQGPQDGVAVVVRRPQCWLRHGASVLDKRNSLDRSRRMRNAGSFVAADRRGWGPWLQANS